ncbi:M90 family metallopeptidase [Hydrogenophaga pseudoflava]|uniref:M90 family metallopeptidase n=1 Tax=Hydrogenophaga pseudoflava TaxID=47421 RepID=UPI0027E4C2EA|nr:zinc-dependent peptidase [Hydrogenophaga pseudoflava]MDQ7747376.1 zinc-dependent peptidase [Hydrogenophaga pseudoflava]
MIQTLQRWLPRRWRAEPPVPAGLWATILNSHPFLAELSGPDRNHLRQLSGHFLMEKEFHGAHGLVITDAMALAIAAQACIPLLHIRPPSGRLASHPLDALAWYDDFVGIVVQPGAALARRRVADASGVVHHYDEVLAGEAMDRGPVMLSWQEVRQAPDAASTGSNVVIHEFVHKIDMRGMHAGGSPDGAPALVAGLWGTRSDAQAREHWRRAMTQAYDHFRESVSMAERFGAERPWLDSYAATDPAEFFAVTCEAYFVSRGRFAQEFPALLLLYDGFFRPDT